MHERIASTHLCWYGKAIKGNFRLRFNVCKVPPDRISVYILFFYTRYIIPTYNTRCQSLFSPAVINGMRKTVAVHPKSGLRLIVHIIDRLVI
jgi:hypothetical protein